MWSALIFIAISINLFTVSETENPSYDQGMYKPTFLNYCYEDSEECKDVCGCMLDSKCMVRPIPASVMKVILTKHNHLRKEMSRSEPKASGMPKLEYDAQLEAIAKCWAARCRRDTTDCLLTESYSQVGMNAGMIKLEEMNTSPFVESPYSDTKPLEELWKTVLENWSREIESLQIQQEFSPKDHASVARGAQLVHDQTLAVGCAWSGSPEGSFFFCAYGPGIRDNATIYKTGPQCSTCPPGLKCHDESEGMCVKYPVYPSEAVVLQEQIARAGGHMYKPLSLPTVRSDASSFEMDLKFAIVNYLLLYAYEYIQ